MTISDVTLRLARDPVLGTDLTRALADEIAALVERAEKAENFIRDIAAALEIPSVSILPPGTSPATHDTEHRDARPSDPALFGGDDMPRLPRVACQHSRGCGVIPIRAHCAGQGRGRGGVPIRLRQRC